VHLKDKSEFNIASAELLIEHSYYAPSIHCSYYGAYQFSKTTLNKIGLTYENLDSLTQSNSSLMGSHNVLISEISKKYEEKTSRLDGRELKNNFKLLKTYRHMSDYDNILVDSTKSTEALRISKEIIRKIKQKL